MVELFQTLWSRRYKIIKVTGVFIVLGLIVAIFSPIEYQTNATLLPEIGESSVGAGGLLRQYGGILGISGASGGTQGGEIPPQLYPDIAKSLPFQLELMNAQIYFSDYDTTTTIHTYFTAIYQPSLLSYVKEYTVGLPNKIIGLFRNKKDDGVSITPNYDSTILALNNEEMATIKKLRERISVRFNDQTGIISFSAKFPDPLATAAIGKKCIELLKDFVNQYRTEKAKQNLNFVQERVKEAEARFDTVKNELADFRDSNISLATARAESRLQELQSEYDMAFNLYNSLNQRLEQSKLDLQEETPVLTVLQPVSVPLEKSSPKRAMILITFTLFGGIISCGWILIRKWWQENQTTR